MYERIKNIHFVGIGGIGMSGIAEVLMNLGYSVSGSDVKSSNIILRLQDMGANISIGHKSDNVLNKDVVVYSSIIKDDNPEIQKSHNLGIPVIPRAEMLAELMRMKFGIIVAGSHGKTTTTSFISSVLHYSGLDPTIVVGGKLRTLGTNAYLGKGKFMVVEADESDGSFLKLSPIIAVVTNIDNEHMDYYKNEHNLNQAFTDFINKVPFYGLSVICADDKRAMSIVGDYEKRYVTYGLVNRADLMAKNINVSSLRTSYNLIANKVNLGEVQIQLPGIHNALNSLVSFAVGFEIGLSFEDIKSGLEKFSGIERRIQVKDIVNGITVIDDYGHHPREMEVTLDAVKQSFRPQNLHVIFQPHRYSRTLNLFNEFVKVLGLVDRLYLIDIYPAGECPIDNISSDRLASAIKKAGNSKVIYYKNETELIHKLKNDLKPGDVVITLGAGNVWMLGEMLIKELKCI
jgi:UDP-N-acetylmuramate--alanine ligase